MDDDYAVEEWSDVEDDYDSSSSDDEVQSFLKNNYGLVKVKDDFESEVEKVMSDHLKKIGNIFLPEELPTSSRIIALSNSHTDSPEDTKKTNEDLFYDPDMDDDDEKWINEKRRSYIYPSEKSEETKPKPLPNSDAVLNCPACLTLLCLDCQRHSIYKSQYRAMFVSNCTVISDETLCYPLKKKKNSQSNESYNPVHCSVCNTEVAVYDTDEVFHFFNVLASYA